MASAISSGPAAAGSAAPVTVRPVSPSGLGAEGRARVRAMVIMGAASASVADL